MTHKEMYDLHTSKGFSFRQIADMAGTTRSIVSGRVHRHREAIREDARDLAIMRDLDAGKSHSKIRLAHAVSERHIRHMAEAMEQN